MRFSLTIKSFAYVVATVVAAIATIQCSGSGSPATPTAGGVAIASVTLDASTVVAGSTAQGTVTLAAAAPAGGASIALASSNPAVATVQTAVTIAAGSMSAPFTVTAVASGTATITATVNGSSRQSPAFMVTRVAALS